MELVVLRSLRRNLCGLLVTCGSTSSSGAQAPRAGLLGSYNAIYFFVYCRVTRMHCVHVCTCTHSVAVYKVQSTF